MGCQCTKSSDDLDIKIDKKEKEKDATTLSLQNPGFLGDYKFEGKTPRSAPKIFYDYDVDCPAEGNLKEAKMIDDGVYSDTPNSYKKVNLKEKSSDASFDRCKSQHPYKLGNKIILREGKFISNYFHIVPYNFNKSMIDIINLARANPCSFSKNIVDQIQYIKENDRKNSKGDYVLLKEDICKVGLIRGKEAFIESAEMMSVQPSLSNLEYREDMCMQISNEREDWVDKDFIESYLEEKSSYLNYKYFGFHFDLGVVDPMTSVVLQIVDDNLFSFQRRNNILNPNYKFIGISNKKIDNHFCVYLTFAC